MSKEYDIYRDSNLRYFGYANEVGEAFRPLVPASVVHGTYGVATTYVCADVWDKASKMYRNGGGLKKSALVAGDVFIWQMLASVIVPGFTINRITWLAARLTKGNRIIRKTVPTAVGLLSIPLIIKPIDHLVDKLMEKTYRKYLM